MDHLFNIYSMIVNENNNKGYVNPDKFREKLKVCDKRCVDDKWLMEMIYSFYNLGYENGMCKGKDNN